MMVRNPRHAFLKMVRAWNDAVERWPGVWPSTLLDPGDKRPALALADDQINPGFLSDLECMLAAFSSRLELPEGFTEPFARSTRVERRRVLKRLYTIAVRHHRPTPVIASLDDLLEPKVVRSILEFYLNKFGQTNTKSAAKYAHVLFVVAKYWLRKSEEQLRFLRKYRKNLRSKRQNGMTEKNRSMLRVFENDTCVVRLLAYGEESLKGFCALAHPTVSDARKLELALAIELLIAAPVRPHNLVSIYFSRHLIHGQDGTVNLFFPDSEVKNDIDLEFSLPARVIKILEVFRAKARPLLARDGNDYLFCGRGLNHKKTNHFSTQIAETVKRVTGVRVQQGISSGTWSAFCTSRKTPVVMRWCAVSWVIKALKRPQPSTPVWNRQLH